MEDRTARFGVDPFKGQAMQIWQGTILEGGGGPLPRRKLVISADCDLANDKGGGEFFALEGVSQLLDTIDRIKDSFQHNLRIEGILLTMFDDRTNLAKQVAQDLKEFFGDEVFKTVIARSIRLAEAPSHGLSILGYDPRSKAAESYIRLAKELLERHQAANNLAAGN